MTQARTIEVPIGGMDCAECTVHVRQAIAALPGVETVNVFLAGEKAVIQLDPAQVTMSEIKSAVQAAGYSVTTPAVQQARPLGDFAHTVLSLFGLVFGVVLFVVVIGEWLGLFETLTERVPFVLGVVLVLLAGWPVLVNVIRAALKRQVISHTLMTLGVLAALAVGQWATAVVVVLFMRVGDYAERFTTERARRAVKDLTALAPQTARVEREGGEHEIPIGEVRIGETVIVRPGEKIPVDGEVIGGQATVDQSAITGESMPVEAGPGTHVFAATLARLGSLRVRTTLVGADTTFGRVIKLVEEAEANRAVVERIADKFSAYYLPVVAGLAALTFLLRRDPLATAAVLVVACSCSIALATPIAMLASVGAGARRGLLIKGAKYLESLARADVLLVDKTGTLTLGQPHITDVWTVESQPLNAQQSDTHAAMRMSQSTLLKLAASAERYSEHPLAEAVRVQARERELTLFEPEEFQAFPGKGVRARVNGSLVAVGNRRMIPAATNCAIADEFESQGKTLLFVECDGQLAGLIAAADTVRVQVPQALANIRALGVQVELLTGDNELTASNLAHALGVNYRSNLLPEDKIRIVKEYQSQGHTVVMVGDGVNDAPALAQADIGIAMGAAGSDVAIEAAHIALMREDWNLVPEVLHIARRTMKVVKMNLLFTALYNIVGLSLAALGILPPMLAAAAQSLPDLGILGNSSRLLRQ